MAKGKQASSAPVRRGRPPLDPEARESEMVSLAVNLAEQQLRDGTASSQVIVHYLKLATMREKLEREQMIEDIKLRRAKTEALNESKEYKTIVEEALKAMQNYKGLGEPDEYRD